MHGTTTPPIPSTKNRYWMFTLNNHSSVEVPRTIDSKYCVWQEEIGESNTPHLQGYVVFPGPKSLSSLKTILPTAHWEIRRGTHEQARDYCTKKDTRKSGPWTIGEEPKEKNQGARSDLLSLKRALDSTDSQQQIWDENFPVMLKYWKAAGEYKRVKSMANPRDSKTVCIVIYGATGSGKTHAIKNFDSDAYWVSKPPKGSPLWMDGYTGQSTVVIDEYYGWIPYDTLLRICDAYPLQLPTKGGHTGFNPSVIFFTSNKPPEMWYDYSKFSGGFDPLNRRLEYIIEKRDLETYSIWKQPSGEVELSIKAPINLSFAEVFLRKNKETSTI